MDLTLVSHTHWDREWYRTFQGFRARLVDTVDRILELAAEDPEFRFLLDGQTIVLEDYLEIRPHRREELAEACRSGKIAIGPWYVQPDSLLPHGETHLRNLLEGRRVGAEFGGVSQVAYTPDSFGHPAQFPQIFAGFGLGPFVYWRGNGNEIDSLPAEYRWVAPDGTSVLAHHLGEGYFGACGLPEDTLSAAVFLQDLALRLRERSAGEHVLLMNGLDHAAPDPYIGRKLEALRRVTGWKVRRGLLEDFVENLSDEAPRFSGELVGGRLANLLPGVWSSRMPIKYRNRQVETALLDWAEPFAVLGQVYGGLDEKPALREAWRVLLQNQAHDTLGGCSRDRVHQQSLARYDQAEELANETTERLLQRLAGAPLVRRTPWSDTLDVAVFNPSPFWRSDAVRLSLDAEPWLEFRGEYERAVQVHPFLGAAENVAGFLVEGKPACLFDEPWREGIRMAPDLPPRAVEFLVEDVPPFGWRKLRLTPAEAQPDEVDEERTISVDGVTVGVAEDGTLDLEMPDLVCRGLLAVEDFGDRGDTYDFDPVGGGVLTAVSVQVERRRHAHGVQSLRSRRCFEIPAGLGEDRSSRLSETVRLEIDVLARLVPGTGRVDLDVYVVDPGRDHRLRLLLPTGERVDSFATSTTFDVAHRETAAPAARDWVHPAPRTFCHQGMVAAGALWVGAPGLPEAEVSPEGVVAITLQRSVEWLARTDLKTRPEPAGPMLRTPAAQCLEPFAVQLHLASRGDGILPISPPPAMKAVIAGDDSLMPPDSPMLQLPAGAALSAWKPAACGEGWVVRMLNPTAEPITGSLRLGLPFATVHEVGLDEERLSEALESDLGEVRVRIRPHGLLTLHFDAPS
jgi:mannosylglycerate hydrolase